MTHARALKRYKKARAKADRAKAKERKAWDVARAVDPRFQS